MGSQRGLGTSTSTPVVNKGFGAMNFDHSGKYSHILKEDGTYIEPKDFLDEFHIHMHQNR